MALSWGDLLLLGLLGFLSAVTLVHGTTCSTTSIANMQGDTASAISNSASSQAACETACQEDPTCLAITWASSTCKLHTGKSAYQLSALTGATHVYLTGCNMYWNFAAHTQGCGTARPNYPSEYAGSAGKVTTAKDRQSCWYQCLEYPRCAGWDWTTGTSQCKLLSEVGVAGATATSGTEHYTIICPTEPRNSFPAGQYWPAMHVAGGKWQQDGVSFLACIASCTSTCKAIDWDVDHKACWHHTSDGTDTSCTNFPKYSKNTYHVKLTACTTTNYPAAFITVT